MPFTYTAGQDLNIVSHPVVETGSAATCSADGDEPLPDGQPVNITFTRSGRTAELTPGQTVLEAAEDAGVDIPFECRSGMCGQCRTQLVSGRVTMEVEDALRVLETRPPHPRRRTRATRPRRTRRAYRPGLISCENPIVLTSRKTGVNGGSFAGSRKSMSNA